MIKLSGFFNALGTGLVELVHDSLFFGGSVVDEKEHIHVSTFVATLSFTDADGDITMVSTLYENQSDTISLETITHDLLSQNITTPMHEWRSLLVMVNPEQFPGQEMWVQREIENRRLVETMHTNEK